MSIQEKLRDFVSSISGAMSYPSDDYLDWSYFTYESHVADIKHDWKATMNQFAILYEERFARPSV